MFTVSRAAVAALIFTAAIGLPGGGARTGNVSASTPQTDGSDAIRFMAANNEAMAKMMAGMNIVSTGDVDADFVAMMTPHHQGAIDMAFAVLRYGRNEKIRRIAQEIIVTQQQEIVAMRAALEQAGVPPTGPAEEAK